MNKAKRDLRRKQFADFALKLTAEGAYNAYVKIINQHYPNLLTPKFDKLSEKTIEAWMAAAEYVWDEATKPDEE